MLKVNGKEWCELGLRHPWGIYYNKHKMSLRHFNFVGSHSENSCTLKRQPNGFQ